MSTILYVTRNSYSGTIPTITPEEARLITRQWKIYPCFDHDIETTGHDPTLHQLLLEAWWPGNEAEPVLVIDSRTVRTQEVIDNNDLKNKIIRAHNADFEARWALWRGITEGEYSCTLVNERVILSGANELKYDIINCLKRRGITPPPEMDKNIRREFIGARADFVIEDRHILYNANDILKLAELAAKQQNHIEKLNINFLVHRLRSPLIKILAQTELTGFVHNTQQWMENVEERKAQAAELCSWMDDYLITQRGISVFDINTKLREDLERIEKRHQRLTTRLGKLITELDRLECLGKTNLKSYQLMLESKEKVLAELEEEVVQPIMGINWGSAKQAKAALKAIGIDPLPMAQDNKTHRMKEGVGKAARTNWFADHATHPELEFMKKFDDFKKVEHNIKSFGQKWIEQYYNPVTGKVHTIFRQTGTKTGRFASGERKKGYFNLQQIPKHTKKIGDEKIPVYRICFGTEPGRSIGTFDYTGCEIVCMISLSNDLELKRISELPDQHSYMGTKCWRNVFAHRYKKTGDEKWKILSETYQMSSKETPAERDKFKQSGVFPVIYGVKEAKVASIQGFSKDEATIFIQTIEAEMPNVVNFVKSKAEFALRAGYVLHNHRTNSRRWFTKVLDAAQYQIPLSNGDRATIETAARNSPIQGTNVDIIIEAIVTIMRWARLFKVDLRLLGQVHDELIFDFKDEDAEWIPGKIKSLMTRTAQRYLIPEISMDASSHVCKTWYK